MIITRKELREMTTDELKSLYAFYKNKRGYNKLILKSVFNEIVEREIKKGVKKSDRLKALKKSLGIDI